MGSWEGRRDEFRAQSIHRKGQKDWKKKRLLELRREGLTLEVISVRLGVPVRQLTRWERAAGIPPARRRGGRPRGR